MKSTRGITLLSLNDTSYGKFALGMLASIKAYTELPVQLICDDASVSHVSEHLDKFDVVTKMEQIDYSTEYQFDAARAKVNLYKYLEFDQTIYLDVDGIMLDDITPLFDTLKKEDIYIQGMYYNRPCHWASKENVNKYIPIKKGIRDINSSFMYIKKGKKAKDFFELTESYYSSGILPKDSLNNTWGGLKYPDELFFSISLDSLEIYTDNDIVPIYFNDNKGDVIKQMQKHNSYVMALYGNERLNTSAIMYLYDVYAFKHLNKLEIPYIWNCKKLMKNKYVNVKKNTVLLRR